MTTITNITDTQIRQLADDAGWHGDYTMMAICEIALTGVVDQKLDRLLNDEDRAIVARFGTPAAARAECARVLAEGGALTRSSAKGRED